MSNQSYDAVPSSTGLSTGQAYPPSGMTTVISRQPTSAARLLLIAAFVLPVSLVPSAYGIGSNLPLMPLAWWTPNLILILPFGVQNSEAARQTSEARPVESAANRPAVTIPNSDHNLRCLVNLNGYAVSYRAERWANVPLVTDLSVRHNTVTDARERFEEVLGLIRQNNPQALVGRYISGGRVERAMKQYPPEAISDSEVPPKWRRPDKNRVDLSNEDAASGFADLIIAESSKLPSQIVFLDNIVHPSAQRGWVSWEHTCSFLKLVKDGVNKNGSLLIANIALAPWDMPDEEVKLLSDAVDGMSFEMPFHRHACGNRQRTESLIATYRKWLADEKIVVLIPVVHALKKIPKERRESEKISEAHFLAGFAMLIREPGDRLFVASPFWQPEPKWARWPKSFEIPSEDKGWSFKEDEDHVLIRRFEHRTLKINVLKRNVDLSSYSRSYP